MDASHNMNADAGWKSNNRPQSTLAQDFSATLDEMFRLNGVSALEDSLVQKKDTVQSQQYQLEDLEAKLREADQRLKQLETKHRRTQSEMKFGGRQRHPVSCLVNADDEDSSGESDALGRSSPEDERSRQH
ncbi:uncharacterized protein PV06_08573 [Exophiala oligosperma]|uniref:Uncharacterized protein n=2 Tax=Chaetothyriales TaxID=34395 RepID=A0A0D2BRF9_9EURO|nr:uncharacterized protein PV06_08573 [Exophiala oligosperma]KIW40017.1 hypothetical protein PV06_08573 [Exophiala oligosperma]